MSYRPKITHDSSWRWTTTSMEHVISRRRQKTGWNVNKETSGLNGNLQTFWVTIFNNSYFIKCNAVQAQRKRTMNFSGESWQQATFRKLEQLTRNVFGQLSQLRFSFSLSFTSDKCLGFGFNLLYSNFNVWGWTYSNLSGYRLRGYHSNLMSYQKIKEQDNGKKWSFH